MRVFIGIEFDSNVLEYLTKVQDLVKQGAKKGNYTLFNNFHLTLRFIGEVTNQEVDTLCHILDEVSEHCRSFNIKIGNLNSFNRHNKHLVYVDVIHNQDKLSMLAYNLERKLDGHFKARTDQFKPHITIAREVELAQESVLNLVTSYEHPIATKQITLFVSERKQNQLIYTPLYRVRINNH